ncbi:MAG: cysteine--tRNA ligase [Nanoarchaeota archaeon]
MEKDVPLLLYNTLTRKKDVFKPIKKGHVGLYSCGPTVYWDPTIGNWRTYLFVDSLRRVLEFNGLNVKHVMNVTDVGHLVGDGDSGEDKMETAALRERKSAQEIATYYLHVFQSDMAKLHVLEPRIWCKATEHVKEQIALITKLEKKGYTYRTSDGIYFDSRTFKEYGKMARLNVTGLQAGKRVSTGEKKHKTDFALWKFSERAGERQQEWDSPWGVGYPGWHIECSAMSMKYLGKTFDIHTGGEDHISVHHTNEIAQSEAVTGKTFVNYWLHGAFLTFKGEKVSKSKGGLYTISELEALGYAPMHYRYLCFQTHYRKPLDFSLASLDAAKNAFERLVMRYRNIRADAESERNKKLTLNEQVDYRRFLDVLNDDLNLPVALSVLWAVVDSKHLSNYEKLTLIDAFDNVFGFGLSDSKEAVIPAEVFGLVAQRDAARAAKNWKLADTLRADIRTLGYEIEDTSETTVVRKIR